MRSSLCLPVFLLLVGGHALVARGDIEYHFMPNEGGQTYGNVQFSHVAPVSGPANFTVQLSASVVGSNPNGNNTVNAFLDKWGLGVFNQQASNNLGVQGQVQVGGKNSQDYLRLEFPEAVQLTYLTFASVGLKDQFGLIADGQQVDLDVLFPGLPTIKAISNSQGSWPGHIDFTRAAEPLVFAKVWDVLWVAGDGFQLENVGVNPVPEPTTLLLWFVGTFVGGCYFLRSRRCTSS